MIYLRKNSFHKTLEKKQILQQKIVNVVPITEKYIPGQKSIFYQKNKNSEN